MNTTIKYWLWVMVFNLTGFAATQHRLNIENSLNTDEYYQAWQQATLDEVKEWIQTGSGVNARDEEGSTPLMIAASNTDNPEVINVLINAGAEVNARTEIGVTPLIGAAALNNNPEVIKVLLASGADATLNTGGIKAIDFAKKNEALKDTDAYWQLNEASF